MADLSYEERMARRKHLDHLENQITELAAHIQAATYRLLVLLREYDEGGGWHGPGLYSCAHWLNWRCGISIGAAREKVRVAHALKHLPKISAAFEAGTISYSKARAMTRVANPANEQNLLDFARCTTASHVERLVREYRKVKRVEAIEKGQIKHHERRLRWYCDDEGGQVSRHPFFRFAKTGIDATVRLLPR